MLVICLIAIFGLYVWQQETGRTITDLVIPMAPDGEHLGPASHTGIDELELIDVNFWEARVALRYSLEQGHGNGYVALHMTDGGWHSNVGLRTRPGQAKGVALLSRHGHRPEAYAISKVRAQMYDPYRRDRNYYEQYHNIDIQWPGAETLSVITPPDAELFNSVQNVRVFRNVPNYVKFAEALVGEGVPPEIIDFQLAVCPSCAGSVIFGEGVPIAAVQAVIRALMSHGFELDRIEYSEAERHNGDILIGQTPTDESRPFWSVREKLVANDTSADEFLELIGFDQPPAAEQAVALHTRAKALIDYSGRRKDLAKAGELLDRAVVLDSSYIPIYIEMARLQARKTRGFSDREPSETAQRAIGILKNALKVDPDFANTYVLLGYYQTAMHQFAEAAASFDRAEELGTANLWLYANRSIWHELNDQQARAVKALERVAEHELDESDNDRALRWALQHLAPHYVDLERYAEAQNVYERFVGDFPGNAYMLRSYGYFLATYTDQHTRLEEIVAEAGRTGCDCHRELEALAILVQAARMAPQDSAAAVRMVVQAQSAGLNLNQVSAYLSVGGSGRLLLGKLMPDVVSMSELEEQGTPLVHMVASPEARAFWLQHGADPNKVDPGSGLSALMLAVVMQDLEAVSELLRYGGDPMLTSKQGLSALALAKEMNIEPILAMFAASRA